MTENSSDRAIATCEFVARGKDIWIRARINAFAHKVTAERAAMLAHVISLLETLFIVIPIACVGISLFVVTDSTLTQMWPRRVYQELAVASIIGNAAALFLQLVNSHFGWSGQARQHNHLLASYQLIAQKARRLENRLLPSDEAIHLCRHLEESFEIYKATGIEPSDSAFVRARELFLKMPILPFEIRREDLGVLKP